MTYYELLLAWIITSIISVLLGYLWISDLRKPNRTLVNSLNAAVCSLLIAVCYTVFYLACFLTLARDFNVR